MALVLATGAFSVFSAGASDQEPPAETLEVGHAYVGDLLEYDLSLHLVPEASAPGREASRSTFFVRGPTTILDQTLTPRDTIQVDHAQVKFVGSTGLQHRGIWSSYIDAGSRELMRLNWNSDTQFGGIPQTAWNRSAVALFPDFGGSASVYGGDFERLALLHGRTLRAGEPMLVRHGPLLSPVDPSRYSAFELDLELGGHGTFQDEHVQAVRFRQRTHLLYDAGQSSFLLTANGSHWYRPGDPYPVRMEFEWTIEWEDVNKPVSDFRGWQNMTLVTLRQGSHRVLWGEEQPRSRPSAPIGLPRTSRGFPVAGNGWAGSYGPEEAVASILADPTLVDFQSWRSTRPDARVVGLFREGRLEGTVPTPAEPQWRVSFGIPGGDTLRTIASYRSATGLITNREPRPEGIPLPLHHRFRGEDLPPSLLTLAALDRIWNTLSPAPTTQRDPNFIQWGYGAMAQAGFAPRPWFSAILYGHHEPGLELDANTDYLSLLNATSGNFSYGFTTTKAPDYLGTLSQFSPTPSGVEAAPAPGMVENRVRPWILGALGVSAFGLLFAAVYPFLQKAWFALFTRLDEPVATRHGLRRQLSTLIREHPGISPPALGMRTGAAWSTLNYHLAVLQRSRIITSVRDGRHRRYYPSSVPTQEIRRLAPLANDQTRQVFQALQDEPGADRVALARRFRWTPAGALWHLERLREAGLVRAEKTSSRVRYYPSAEAT